MPQNANLISIKDLDKQWISELFEEVKSFKKSGQVLQPNYKHRTVLLFFENSTRTKISFKLAAQQAECDVLDFQLQNSSTSKGEVLTDTIQNLYNYGYKVFVVRHNASYALSLLADEFNDKGISIINAGAGMCEHPTQALLDGYTIYENEGHNIDAFEGKTITIIGDCLHSRVVRSNIYLLQKLGMRVKLVGPPSLVPSDFEQFGVQVSHDLLSGIKGSDYIMSLRIQFERQGKSIISSIDEYSKYYGLTIEKIEKAGLDLDRVKIMHPGPVNRGIDMSGDLMDNDHVSLINSQVVNGIYVRKQIIERLIKSL